MQKLIEDILIKRLCAVHIQQHGQRKGVQPRAQLVHLGVKKMTLADAVEVGIGLKGRRGDGRFTVGLDLFLQVRQNPRVVRIFGDGSAGLLLRVAVKGIGHVGFGSSALRISSIE